MLSTPENAEEVAEQKKLDDLMTDPSGNCPGQPPQEYKARNSIFREVGDLQSLCLHHR